MKANLMVLSCTLFNFMGRLANGFKLWQYELFPFELENLNWKNLNCCLAQIILIEILFGLLFG